MSDKDDLKEVFDAARKVQDLLNQNHVSTQEYLYSIPVILTELYPNRDDLLDMLKILTKQASVFHTLIHKRK